MYQSMIRFITIAVGPEYLACAEHMRGSIPGLLIVGASDILLEHQRECPADTSRMAKTAFTDYLPDGEFATVLLDADIALRGDMVKLAQNIQGDFAANRLMTVDTAALARFDIPFQSVTIGTQWPHSGFLYFRTREIAETISHEWHRCYVQNAIVRDGINLCLTVSNMGITHTLLPTGIDMIGQSRWMTHLSFSKRAYGRISPQYTYTGHLV
jgi:hypothetical protein